MLLAHIQRAIMVLTIKNGCVLNESMGSNSVVFDARATSPVGFMSTLVKAQNIVASNWVMIDGGLYL